MPSEIKWIDAREFRELGFLQEANRQFFHPHGLALAVTTVKGEEDGPVHTLALTAAQYERLLTLAADDEDLLATVKDAAHYDVGDSYFQGCWDDRDDLEGVVFGGWPERDQEKAETVAAERERHRGAREALFGTDSDVEPVGWKISDEQLSAWNQRQDGGGDA